MPDRDPVVEKWKSNNESSLVYLSGNKIAVLVRSADKANQFII
jgi:hypothetical protein